MRARGKTQFLIRHGFFGRGLPLGVLVALVIELALGHALAEALRAPVFWARLVALVALFTATGVLRAQVTWNAYEKRFGGGV